MIANVTKVQGWKETPCGNPLCGPRTQQRRRCPYGSGANQFQRLRAEARREAIPRLLKGDPKYGVPVLDPVLVEEVVVRDSGITIAARNFTIEGAKEAVLQDVRVDFEKLTISLQFQMPTLTFRRSYEISGKLVALPINGKGNFNSSFDDLKVKYVTYYNFTKHDDGNTYLQPYDYEMSFDTKVASLYFENLFNGNKLLGDAMNNFIKENWRIVLDQIG
ncbi:protein takeout-like [Zootermopsis nevadensis]|uniref:protein takeout-like n=1 Tax=Zootermopsis nevadensis TaxID=136037 RepID=UPI000B8EAE6E|nr:protein takeout-like [Zootermopsis nevadensis]